MKRFFTMTFCILMILSTSVVSFADSKDGVSESILDANEKAAILEQIPSAEQNPNGSITIPLKTNESIFVDLGNGLTVEYEAIIPLDKSPLAVGAAETKNVSVKKTYWWNNLASMQVTFKANCTWGSPARTVKMNSLDDSYIGGYAEFISHSTKVTVPVSTSGGTARGEARGEIRFYSAYDGKILGTKSYYNTLYVDSADSSTLYLIEN